jgi:hypothetical protein
MNMKKIMMFLVLVMFLQVSVYACGVGCVTCNVGWVRVAVLPFIPFSGSNVSMDQALGLSTELMELLNAEASVSLIDGRRLLTSIATLRLAPSDFFCDDQLAQLGKSLDADFIITGRFLEEKVMSSIDPNMKSQLVSFEYYFFEVETKSEGYDTITSNTMVKDLSGRLGELIYRFKERLIEREYITE